MSLICQISTIIRLLYSVAIFKRVTIIFLILSLLFADLKGVSQTKEIDSLKAVALVADDTGKTKILLSIAEKYRIINYDSVVIYVNKALENAEFLKNNNLIVESLLELAYINQSMGNNTTSISLYNEAKQLCIVENNQFLLAKVYIDLGRYYESTSNYAEVISSLNTSLNIINENNITILKPIIYNKIGHLYLLIHDYSVASYYSNLAIRYSKADKNKTDYINNLFLHGKILLQKNKLDSTKYYYKIALAYAKEANNKVLIQQAYRRMSDYYIEKEEYNKSNIYIDSSIIYCNELNLINEWASLITYKAHIASIKNDNDNALKYNLQALELRKETGHFSSICASLLNIGGNYTQLGNYEKAHLYLENGLKSAQDKNIIHYLAYGYEKLSQLYRKEGNYEKALQYTELKTQYRDAVITNRSNEKVMFFRSQYEAEKEKTLSEKIKLKKKANEVIFLIIATLLSVGVIILLIRLNYVRKKSTKEIIKLSRVIETTTQSVVITNSQGKVLYVNYSLLVLLGYNDKSEVLGKSMFDFTDIKGKELLTKEILPDLLTKGNWNGEITNMKKDGTYFIAEATCSIIKDENGEPEYFVAIFNDITNRKNTELELKTIRENLEKTVKTRDKMFSIIAHDLTVPFSSILGFSELMAKDFDKYQKNELIRFSQLIYESSKNAFDLLTNLLNWSRSQLGSIQLAKEDLNIYELVSSSSESLVLMLNKKEISFHNEVIRDISVYADNNTISVVVRNILSNAIKFTPRGGTIKVKAVKVNSKVNIIFTDTGIGIESEHLSGLFDINKNKSNKGTENEKGTGLGLILCKEFTELNDGKISVESTYGRGSIFTLTLPTTDIAKQINN